MTNKFSKAQLDEIERQITRIKHAACNRAENNSEPLYKKQRDVYNNLIEAREKEIEKITKKYAVKTSKARRELDMAQTRRLDVARQEKYRFLEEIEQAHLKILLSDTPEALNILQDLINKYSNS